MPRTFSVADLALEGEGVWRVRIDDRTGTVLFDGDAVELLAELNGRQRAIFGNALEGRMISLAGLAIVRR
jgi:hypothetical protein